MKWAASILNVIRFEYNTSRWFYEWIVFAHKPSIDLTGVVVVVASISAVIWLEMCACGVAACIIKTHRDVTFFNNLFYEHQFWKLVRAFYSMKINNFIYIIDKIDAISKSKAQSQLHTCWVHSLKLAAQSHGERERKNEQETLIDVSKLFLVHVKHQSKESISSVFILFQIIFRYKYQ